MGKTPATKIGRPPKYGGRSHKTAILLPLDEHERYRLAAERAETSLGEYVRRCLADYHAKRPGKPRPAK